jgi:LAS superfamily LD-carboxypeptidase LdcB
MTHQDGAPLTRRALRTQATAGAPSPARLPQLDDAPGTASRPALTRRELRLAGATRPVVATDACGPSTPLPTTQPAKPARAEDAAPAAATDAARPLTRRELRLRERAEALATGSSATPSDDDAPAVAASDVASACRPPFVASLVLPVTAPDATEADRGAATPPAPATAAHSTRTAPSGRRDLRPGARAGASSAQTGGSRRLLAHVGRKPVAVVALSAGLLTVGVTQVQAEQGVVAEALAAAEAARAETERQQRSDGAASDRLMAQAAAYAAAQRNQAVAAAEEAVAAAHGAKEVAAPVLDAETVARLEQAAAELAAMLEAAPAPVLPAASPQADTGAAGDADADTVGEDDAADRVDQPSRSVPAEGRAPLPDAATSGAAADAPAAPTETADTGTVDAGQAADAPPAELVDALPDLDIELSRRIHEQAEAVAALTVEVQGLADAKIAEAAAAALAAEEARLAAEAAEAAAAAELARKVAVAKSAGNGDIPADVLCGVGFDDGVQLRCDAAAALEQLNAAYRADFGRDLDVVSSYRSYSQQVAVKRTRGGLAAAPGTSNHGLGVAVDFADFGGLGNFSTANYRWMRANAERFGWYHPRIMQPGGGGPQEPWHWEFGTDS